MEETKIATDEERVQLANDVLLQLEAGSLCGVPPGNWFVGFPFAEVVPYLHSVHLEVDDLSEHCISSYSSDEDENEEGAKVDDDYWVIGARGSNPRPGGQPDSLLETDLQEILTKFQVCEVCAVGALVVAAAKRYDNMKVGDLEEFGVFVALKPYFERRQLLLIEMAYERGQASNDHTREQVHLATHMWPEVPTGSKRLKLIMENIVTNNGTFVLPDVAPSDS